MWTFRCWSRPWAGTISFATANEIVPTHGRDQQRNSTPLGYRAWSILPAPIDRRPWSPWIASRRGRGTTEWSGKSWSQILHWPRIGRRNAHARDRAAGLRWFRCSLLIFLVGRCYGECSNQLGSRAASPIRNDKGIVHGILVGDRFRCYNHLCNASVMRKLIRSACALKYFFLKASE